MDAIELNNDQKVQQIKINFEKTLKRQDSIRTQNFVDYQNQALKIFAEGEKYSQNLEN